MKPFAGEDEMARSLRDSVVGVRATIVAHGKTVELLGAERSGSGVIIGRHSVLTIGYLVMEAEEVEISLPNGKRIPATLTAFDHGTGFGLVKTSFPLTGKPLELGDSDSLGERARTLTLGFGEDEATPIFVVSRRPFVGNWEYLVDKAIFTFPPVNNWSGSALVDGQGKLVGLGSLIVKDAMPQREGVPGNMYVPVNLVKPILAELERSGRARQGVQPWLGMTTEEVRGNLLVTRVSRGSPADLAGIAAGDIILGIDEERVADQAGFYRKLWAIGPVGTEVSLRLLQGMTVKDLKLRSMDRNDYLSKPSGV